MSPLTHIPARRGLAAVLVALAVAGTACSVADDSSVAPIAVDPPVGAPAPGTDPKVDPEAEGAKQVEKNPDAQGLQPVAWDKVSYDRASSELTVWWWSGVEPCTALGDVTVEFGDEEVVVTVLEGMPPEAAVTSCVAMAEYKMFTVALDEDPGQRPFRDGAS